MSRRLTVALIFIFAGLSSLSGVAAARDTYFSPNCGSCHTVANPTCNGCHLHGVHGDIVKSGVEPFNLTAKTDKTSYVGGEAIVISLEGGNMGDFKGWVGVRIYDSAGVEVTRKQAQLDCAPYPTVAGTRCDLPMKLSIPAKEGWTRLYASWAGNQYDRSGAVFGSVIGASFGAGRRALRDGSGNQVANHIEEIVATGTFSVSPAPPMPVPEPPVDNGDSASSGSDTGSGSNGTANAGDTSASDSTGSGAPPATSAGTSQQKSGGGGSFDIWIILFLVVAAAIFATRSVGENSR